MGRRVATASKAGWPARWLCAKGREVASCADRLSVTRGRGSDRSAFQKLMACAIDQLRRALEGREQQLGANHPDTLDAVCELALLLKAQGKLAEAELLFRRALEGYEQQLGAQHPNTLTAVNNLAQLLYAQGKLAEAEPLLRRALEGKEQQLGANHHAHRRQQPGAAALRTGPAGRG